MVKLSRMVDIQIVVMPHALHAEELRRANQVLFTVYEPIRLWLKERQILAPFRKLSVGFVNEETSSATHGWVNNANSVCLIDLLAPLAALKRVHRDRPWAFAAMIEALGHVHERLNWKSEELEARVMEVCDAGLPFTHDFARLTKKDKSTKTVCVPWMRFNLDLIQIGVRFSSPDKIERETILYSRPPPLFFEDRYPIHKSALRGGSFVLLDKAGNELANLPYRVD